MAYPFDCLASPPDPASGSRVFITRPGPNGAYGRITMEYPSSTGSFSQEVFLTPVNWEWLKQFFRNEKEQQMKWAGCNFFLNTGKNPDEPAGTALSMHSCHGCDRDGSCTMQKDSQIWQHTKADEIISPSMISRLKTLKVIE